MTTRKKLFWLSYDLGLKGDYSSLYAWLDSMKAKECGNSIATFWFQYQSDYLKELEQSLKDAIDFGKNDRLYIIWREEENAKSKIKGRFLLGKRKPAPWEGFSNGFEDSTDEEGF